MYLPEAEKLMNRAVEERVFPGGMLLVADGADNRWVHAAGCANLWTGEPVDRHTVFDLASLTKPLATTLAVLYLVRVGRLREDQRLAEIIPDFTGTDKAEITLRHLLCHNSGLIDYRPYYRTLLSLPIHKRRSRLHGLLMEEKPAYPIGSKTLYSDIGFLLLQWIIETVSAMPLDRFVTRKIYAPLGLSGLFFNPHPFSNRKKRAYAATERCPARGLLEGVVHDENAYAIGGVAGHAGLFGTVDAVCDVLIRLLTEYRKPRRDAFFGQEGLFRFFTIPAGAERAHGFDVPSGPNPSAGSRFTPGHTVGHLGFTGTSFWMDLERRLIVILLTNRVHPDRSDERIKSFRPQLHDAVMCRFA